MIQPEGGKDEKPRGEAACLFNRAGPVHFRCCVFRARKGKNFIEIECEHQNIGSCQAAKTLRRGWLQAGVACVHDEMQTDPARQPGV